MWCKLWFMCNRERLSATGTIFCCCCFLFVIVKCRGKDLSRSTVIYLFAKTKLDFALNFVAKLELCLSGHFTSNYHNQIIETRIISLLPQELQRSSKVHLGSGASKTFRITSIEAMNFVSPFHYSPLCSSSKPSAWTTVRPLDMSRPSESGLCGFISKTSSVLCPSDVLTQSILGTSAAGCLNGK